MAMNPCD